MSGHGAQVHGHQHAEAFALMLYEPKDRSVTFVVWNSRDGVTPFGCTINGRDCLHVRWGADIYAPHHQPADNDLVFVSEHPSIDVLREQARGMVERAPEYAPPAGPDRDALIETIAKESMQQCGELGRPALVTGAEYRRRVEGAR